MKAWSTAEVKYSVTSLYLHLLHGAGLYGGFAYDWWHYYVIERGRPVKPGGIPSILSSIFGPMDAVAVVLLVYAVYNLTYSLASTPAGAISDMIGRRNVLVAGFLTFSAVYLGFGLVEQDISYGCCSRSMVFILL